MGALISSSKGSKDVHWWPERGLDINQQQSTITMAEHLETEVLGMLTLLDADSLACACGILGLDRAVGSSPKYITRKTASQIQNNLKNISCYSYCGSTKASKCHTVMVPIDLSF